ncbi:MAG: hypothetical protein ABIU63_17605 [Chitinophagaceae bacterium]
MNKQTLHVPALITGICFFLFSSCYKPPKDFDARDAENVYNGCRINQISTAGVYSSFTRKFSYNGYNDPVSVTGPLGLVNGGTGNPDLVFKYDNKNRLIEFAGLYANGGYEYLHHYKYEQNRIIIDTVSYFGTYGGALPPDVAYSYLRYDNLNRVVQDSFVSTRGHSAPLVINYGYDGAGNRVNGGVYDSKLNPHRTNRIWMFIDRDYSVNNPFFFTAGTYNNSGLPLHVDLNASFLWSYYNGPTDISYDCK